MTGQANGIRVLLADDEPHLGAILEQFLTARGFTVHAVRDGQAALAALRAAPYDVALLDVVMPEMDGLEVLRRVREEATPPEILIITGNGTVETALAALRLGAYDVLSKPYRMAEIEAVIRRAWEKRVLVRDNLRLRARVTDSEFRTGREFVTRYAPLQAVLSTLEPLRAGDAPVMVWGAAGVGKRALARWLHAGRHAAAPFVEVNAAEDTDQVAARLFGTEAPGAEPQVTLGAFDTAADGTLLLRALARLDHALQRAVADAVARGWFTRIGGTQPVRLDARVVTALMRDPATLVAEGALDAGAAHALSVISVALPPLADRLVDAVPIAEAVLEGLGAGHALSPEGAAWLEAQPWPGNVRELVQTVEAAARAHGPRLGAGELARAGSDVPSNQPAGTAGHTLEAMERQHIADTLHAVGWHQGRAADALGISPKTLYRKIREYGFVRPSGRTLR